MQQIKQSIVLDSVATFENNYQPVERTSEELKLIRQLIGNNKLFSDYKLPEQIIEEMGKKILLLWSENPHIAQTSENQVYLLLEGKCFEYIRKDGAKKANEEFLMVKKLQVNEYFLIYGPNNRYKNQSHKKYQLMVDENTLLGKISNDNFVRYLSPLIEQRRKHISTFFRKVQLFSSLPQTIFYELSKYLEQEQFQPNYTVLSRGVKSHFVYFIKEGEVQLNKYLNQARIESTPNLNYHVSHNCSHMSITLKKYAIFGMESMKADDTQEQNSISLQEQPESKQPQYAADTLTKTSLYKIDKRMLAIVVTSFEEEFKMRTKTWSSINLNTQIKGQAYQSPQKKMLQQNVEKIKTAERKARDLKLRYMTPSKSRLKNQGLIEKRDSRDTESREDEDFLSSNLRTKSTSQMLRSRYSVGFGNYNHPKSVIFQPYSTTMSQWENLFKSNYQQIPKMSTVSISAYDDQLFNCPSVRKETPQLSEGRKSFLSARVHSKHQTTGKLQSDIIKNYLQNRAKNQMLTKSQLIRNRRTMENLCTSKSKKRIYSNNFVRRPPQVNKNKDLGQQLFEKMSKMEDKPLLWQVESQKKRVQYQQKHILSAKLLRTSRTKKISKGDELILIKNQEGLNPKAQ